MSLSLSNIVWLGSKELRSFFNDYVMLALLAYTFTFAIVAQAQNTAQEVHNATIAIADEDHSLLSRAIGGDFMQPYFKPAVFVDPDRIARLLDSATYTFVVVLPPHFQSDVQAGRAPVVQIDIDATAAMQAGIGSNYVQSIIMGEIRHQETGSDRAKADAVQLSLHLLYNPNASSGWFMAIMGIVNNITMLSIILSGAAVIREREHGTLDHLLTLPLSPVEIALAKVLANGLVVLVTAAFALVFVVRSLLHVPIAGSIPLFLVGVALYLFYALAVGLFLATVVKTMPQFGLLFVLVFSPSILLSGGNTPIASEPWILRTLMQGVATTHFVSFAQAILFRGAGIGSVWRDFLAVAGLGSGFFLLSVLRFRRSAVLSSG